MDTKVLNLGIDVGSTTIKFILTDGLRELFSCYERHYSRVREKTIELMQTVRQIALERCSGDETPSIRVAISGSAGMGVAESARIPFVQEVFATAEIVRRRQSNASCAIELGGEDAKIIFFSGGLDQRMNGSCAGGTGAFIDQMAALLNATVEQLDELSLGAERIYPIASRCGVFAKTDIQPLINQGARKEDIAASIYQAVVNQTIAGLAQGRHIEGTVLFLGGPLYFCKGLRIRFRETLHLDEQHAIFPEYGRFSVALGAAAYAESTAAPLDCDEIIRRMQNAPAHEDANRLKPLFASPEEYFEFSTRHAQAVVPRADISLYAGNAYLGIDCGSTTTKLALISSDREILYSYYAPNKGNPIAIVQEQLARIYEKCGKRVRICGSAVTGYGEELIKNAFGVDIGLVETIAHYTAARYFKPDVDFILDIGGQDIKCFSIHGGAIDSIMLNEACSSGCGSFLSTFAESMGCTVEEFARSGLKAKAPVNLGSRCTVFMNSSVKQAQKEGADISDISAGLSVSVVKNALYKVIRAGSADSLGKNIVVQGGTFNNDAVLRAFEQEMGCNVIRPNIAGLMGAYGAALKAMECEYSSLMSTDALKNFTYSAKAAMCGGCANHCSLTINTFSGGRKFVAGNRCEKALGGVSASQDLPDIYETKRKLLADMIGANDAKSDGHMGTLGLPLALGMFELLPLWHTLFSELGFKVVVSDMSTRRTYERGQFSIPSDTACYPAKLMHGHIEELIDKGVARIFYPCLSYNVDENVSDNHYNCPIVAYYSELLNGNVDELKHVDFLYPYLNITNRMYLIAGMTKYLARKLPDIGRRKIRRAIKSGWAAYEQYMLAVQDAGERALDYARTHSKRIMVLAGRPYHMDSEICHGIDHLAQSLGFVVVSEDSIYQLCKTPPVHVLNQWTYHSRLYRAAEYAAEHSDVELVQLVSFGCGMDAITADEMRSIMESRGKIYTQIKIDEITNLSAIKIRLRSLLGALDERQANNEVKLLRTVYPRDEGDPHDIGAEHVAAAFSVHLTGSEKRGV